MATLYEQQQAALQQQSQQQQLLKTSVGASVQAAGEVVGWKVGQGFLPGYSTNILATLTGLIGGVSLALSQFFENKKTAEEQQKISQHQKVITDAINSFMDQLDEAGLNLIDQGLNPLTPEFETSLTNNLFQKIGYNGNCNATVWIPGSSGPNRPIWFQVSNNGRLLIPTPNFKDPPPNIQTYWTVKCRDVHDDWYNAYQHKLIIEERNAELQAFQSSLNKSKLIWQIAFGSITAILVLFILMNMVKIK